MARYTAARQRRDRPARLDHPDSWAATCTCGKRVYQTRKAAKAARRRLVLEGRDTGVREDVRLETYACGTGFHIGHRVARGPNLNDGRLRFVESA
jgi:hypothetical protein